MLSGGDSGRDESFNASQRGNDMDLRAVISEVQSWSAEDRLRLIEEVWESLVDAPEALRLTESQTQDLQRRLDVFRDDPGAGSPWEEVKARIQARAG
jgi:putative addiction module component (TIGR02574 family)